MLPFRSLKELCWRFFIAVFGINGSVQATVGWFYSDGDLTPDRQKGRVDSHCTNKYSCDLEFFTHWHNFIQDKLNREALTDTHTNLLMSSLLARWSRSFLTICTLRVLWVVLLVSKPVVPHHWWLANKLQQKQHTKVIATISLNDTNWHPPLCMYTAYLHSFMIESAFVNAHWLIKIMQIINYDNKTHDRDTHVQWWTQIIIHTLYAQATLTN